MEPTTTIEAAPKKMGRPPKAAKVEEVKAEPVTETKPDTGPQAKVTVADIVQTFKAQGIPVSAAHFHQAVRSENHLYSNATLSNGVKSRQANMFLTPLGLIFEQVGKRPGVVPHANIIFCEL